MIKENKPVTQIADEDAVHNLKVDTLSHTIIANVRKEFKAKGMKNPSTSVIIRELRDDSNRYKLMCAHLQNFVGEHGENEGANEVLIRLLHELRQLRAEARHGLDISNIGFDDKHELTDLRVKAHQP